MPEARAFQQSFGAMLAAPAGIADPALRRALAVHRNTAHKAAEDALAANYPVVATLVGADAFAACAHDFVERHPPAEPRLCLYGDGFGMHLSGWPPFAELPFLRDMATLERLVVEALFAADADPLDPGAVASAPDPDMPLVLHPATRIAAFDCPAASLWLAHQDDAGQALEAIDWMPEIALVTRPGLAINVHAIAPAAHAFLACPTLGEAAAAAHARGGDVAAIFAALLTAGALAQPSQQD